MANYLELVGSTYYFHRAVPKELRAYIRSSTGKERADFKISLGTKDRDTAKARVPFYTIETDKVFADTRAKLAAGIAPGDDGPATLSNPLAGHFPQAEALDRLERAGDEYEDWVAYWEGCLSFSPDALSASEAAILDLLRAARRDRDLYKRGMRPLSGVAYTGGGQAKGVSIRGMFEAYASQPGIRPETVKQYRAILLGFLGWLGHDDASAVVPANIIRWRNHLQSIHSNRIKPLSPRTINDSYMVALNVTFAYALDQLAIPTNPMLGVAKVRAEKKVRLREKGFTKAERVTILTAALGPHGPGLSPEHNLARRWIPWLCAYTGARVNEMTQLRAEDVAQIDGVWTIHITPEAGSVKTDTARIVPLHPHLIEQGFPAVALAKATGPLFYDPGRERGGSPRGQYKRMGMRVANWVRSLGIDGVQPNHGWRHTFKTLCLEAGIEERAADYIQGHASKGVGRSYGSNTIPALAQQLAKFPCFPVAGRVAL